MFNNNNSQQQANDHNAQCIGASLMLKGSTWFGKLSSKKSTKEKFHNFWNEKSNDTVQKIDEKTLFACYTLSSELKKLGFRKSAFLQLSELYISTYLRRRDIDNSAPDPFMLLCDIANKFFQEHDLPEGALNPFFSALYAYLSDKKLILMNGDSEGYIFFKKKKNARNMNHERDKVCVIGDIYLCYVDRSNDNSLSIDNDINVKDNESNSQEKFSEENQKLNDDKEKKKNFNYVTWEAAGWVALNEATVAAAFAKKSKPLALSLKMAKLSSSTRTMMTSPFGFITCFFVNLFLFKEALNDMVVDWNDLVRDFSEVGEYLGMQLKKGWAKLRKKEYKGKQARIQSSRSVIRISAALLAVSGATGFFFLSLNSMLSFILAHSMAGIALASLVPPIALFAESLLLLVLLYRSIKQKNYAQAKFLAYKTVFVIILSIVALAAVLFGGPYIAAVLFSVYISFKAACVFAPLFYQKWRNFVHSLIEFCQTLKVNYKEHGFWKSLWLMPCFDYFKKIWHTKYRRCKNKLDVTFLVIEMGLRIIIRPVLQLLAIILSVAGCIAFYYAFQQATLGTGGAIVGAMGVAGFSIFQVTGLMTAADFVENVIISFAKLALKITFLSWNYYAYRFGKWFFFDGGWKPTVQIGAFSLIIVPFDIGAENWTKKKNFLKLIS